MTLGATRSEIRWMVLRQVATIAVAGGVIGLAIALALGRLAQRTLFGLQFYDAVVLASSITVLALATLAAGAVPAHRAARIEPMRALKFE
jgi:ABC-type antimicrobial peptide transport system permease subunit